MISMSTSRILQPRSIQSTNNKTSFDTQKIPLPLTSHSTSVSACPLPLPSSLPSTSLKHASSVFISPCLLSSPFDTDNKLKSLPISSSSSVSLSLASFSSSSDSSCSSSASSTLPLLKESSAMTSIAISLHAMQLNANQSEQLTATTPTAPSFHTSPPPPSSSSSTSSSSSSSSRSSFLHLPPYVTINPSLLDASSWSYRDLQLLCMKLDLGGRGKKEELIEKLQKWHHLQFNKKSRNMKGQNFHLLNLNLPTDLNGLEKAMEEEEEKKEEGDNEKQQLEEKPRAPITRRSISGRKGEEDVEKKFISHASTSRRSIGTSDTNNASSRLIRSMAPQLTPLLKKPRRQPDGSPVPILQSSPTTFSSSSSSVIPSSSSSCVDQILPNSLNNKKRLSFSVFNGVKLIPHRMQIKEWEEKKEHSDEEEENEENCEEEEKDEEESVVVETSKEEEEGEEKEEEQEEEEEEEEEENETQPAVLKPSSLSSFHSKARLNDLVNLARHEYEKEMPELEGIEVEMGVEDNEKDKENDGI